MSHTAGFTMPIVNTGSLPDSYMRLGLVASRIELPQVNRLIQSRPTGLADFSRRLASLPLASDPGSRFEYGESYDLMGALVEKRAGMPYSQWLRREVLAPIGMADTGFTIPADAAGRAAGTYWLQDDGRSVRMDPDGRSVYLSPPPFEDAGNGLVSTPRDACLYARTLLTGRGPVSGRTMERMMTDALTANDGTGRFGPAGDPGYGYGWGGYVRRPTARTPQSVGAYGWGGFGGAYFWVDRRAGFYAVLMCQFAPAGAISLRMDVTRGCYA
jgi:CubicO group peptidase (beta-lactamase class C family)